MIKILRTVGQVVQGFTFSLSGARLVERVRREMFTSMLSQVT